MVNSLFIATPMYGGQCYGAYTDSMIKLCVGLTKAEIPYEFFAIMNESLIDRARNVCADWFLRSNMSHLFFCDADQSGFTPEQIIDLMNRDKDIICGFLPKKSINWKNVVDAVKMGYADDNPEVLSQFAGEMVFTPALNDDSNRYRSIYDLTLLHEGGSGFMLIHRRVFLKIAEANRDLLYHRQFEKPDMMTAFFDAQCEPEWQVYHRRFLSEDFSFCRLARECGCEIWLAPWIKLDHHGYYRFVGNIEAIAALKAPMREAAE